MQQYSVTMLLTVHVSGVLFAENPVDAQNQLRDMVSDANKEFANGNPKLQVEKIIAIHAQELEE